MGTEQYHDYDLGYPLETSFILLKLIQRYRRIKKQEEMSPDALEK